MSTCHVGSVELALLSIERRISALAVLAAAQDSAVAAAMVRSEKRNLLRRGLLAQMPMMCCLHDDA